MVVVVAVVVSVVIAVLLALLFLPCLEAVFDVSSCDGPLFSLWCQTNVLGNLFLDRASILNGSCNCVLCNLINLCLLLTLALTYLTFSCERCLLLLSWRQEDTPWTIALALFDDRSQYLSRSLP